MRCPPLVLGALLVGGLSPVASAELDLTPLHTFVDTKVTSGAGYGCIGVTQDEVVGNFYVVDFVTTNSVHEFDPEGIFVTDFTAASCTPACPSPNDITYSPDTDTLWVLDNGGNAVLNMSRTGDCLGGFNLPALKSPAGISYERKSKTLYVASAGLVSQHDLDGNTLPGGFTFSAPGDLSTALSGVTMLPTGSFLVSETNERFIYEVSPTGILLSTTDMSEFGVVNIQGLHFNHAQGTLLVVDNTLSSVFVFDAGCFPGQPYGVGCAGAAGFVPELGMSGCTKPGDQVALTLDQALGGAMSLLLISAGPASVPLDGGCTLLVQASPLSLVIPVGGHGPGHGSYVLPGLIPSEMPPGSTLYMQAFVSDASGPIGWAATNGLKVETK